MQFGELREGSLKSQVTQRSADWLGLTYSLHCSSFFGFNHVYIKDPEK